MVQVGLGWQVAFELDPIKPIDLSLIVGLDERVQFTIRNPIKHPAIGADVLPRPRQLDPHLRIALGGDRVVIDCPFRARGFESETAGKENCVVSALIDTPKKLLRLFDPRPRAIGVALSVCEKFALFVNAGNGGQELPLVEHASDSPDRTDRCEQAARRNLCGTSHPTTRIPAYLKGGRESERDSFVSRPMIAPKMLAIERERAALEGHVRDILDLGIFLPRIEPCQAPVFLALFRSPQHVDHAIDKRVPTNLRAHLDRP